MSTTQQCFVPDNVISHLCHMTALYSCHVVQHDYKGFSPGVTMENVTEEDWKGAPALQETPVTSAICQPANGAQLEEGTEEVSGEHSQGF